MEPDVADDIVAEEYWAKKGDVDLYVYRKHSPSRRARSPQAPVLFLVHGSSFSSRTTYDLEVPGHGEYSVMNVFASLGYDVWTMDHEGYGRSSHTDGFSFVADGVEDLKAAAPIVERVTGQSAFAYFGTSSGALRAGRFANESPQHVARLALAALVWTGEGSPTLVKRAERLDEWRASNRRAADKATYEGIFSRDIVGLTIPELAEAAASAEMANGGGSVPNGTYIDMCTNLPLVDPERVACPVLIFRGDHDGIATDQDVLGFFARLPTRDKQLILSSGQPHNTSLGINRHRFWHILHAFMSVPARRDELQ
ncbi:MAG: alpha/beta fold hydrolase [Gammaproteobacteria bacterium]|nr:alpha/beta fold hydrolase [Gammaproteobacteria bacterium]